MANATHGRCDLHRRRTPKAYRKRITAKSGRPETRHASPITEAEEGGGGWRITVLAPRREREGAKAPGRGARSCDRMLRECRIRYIRRGRTRTRRLERAPGGTGDHVAFRAATHGDEVRAPGRPEGFDRLIAGWRRGRRSRLLPLTRGRPKNTIRRQNRPW